MSADAIVYTALQNQPLSGGADFEAYWRFMYRRDIESHARGFVFGYLSADPPVKPQSGCALFALGCADTAEVDGRIQWRGRTLDIFASPYAPINGTAPTLCEELGRQRGLLHSGITNERPDLPAGSFVCIGGDDGQPAEKWQWGGYLHVLVVTGGDGTILETVEGGQIDEHNSGFLTAVKPKRRELYQRGAQWWLRTAGTTETGRRVRWWYQAGDLPCRA